MTVRIYQVGDIGTFAEMGYQARCDECGAKGRRTRRIDEAEHFVARHECGLVEAQAGAEY